LTANRDLFVEKNKMKLIIGNLYHIFQLISSG
jgi:hypothetical protein